MVSFLYPFTVSLAAALVVRDKAPQPLSFALEKQPKKALVGLHNPGFSKRDGNEDVKLYTDREAYLVNLGIIYKDQQRKLVVDTGSSDLWVDASRLNTTSGFRKNGEDFGIFYTDTSKVTGDYGTSSVWLENGVEVKDLQWALATDVEIGGIDQNGILGIGKVGLEASAHNSNKPYPNFTQKLKDDGLIGSNSYSYYLNKKGAESGSIIFGGRDLAKVKGPVATITPNTTDYDSAYDSINVSKVTASNGATVDGFEAVLDTGTTLSYLHHDTILGLNVTGVSIQVNHYVIDCDSPTDKYVSFWFDDAEIKVSYKDLAITEYDNDGNPTGRCLFGLQGKSQGDPYVLGQSFLRSAYVTVHHDKNEVLISDVNYTDEENIVAI